MARIDTAVGSYGNIPSCLCLVYSYSIKQNKVGLPMALPNHIPYDQTLTESMYFVDRHDVRCIIGTSTPVNPDRHRLQTADYVNLWK